jgi:hypothetical protein
MPSQNRATNPIPQGLEQARSVILTPREFGCPVCGRLHPRLGGRQHLPTAQAEDRILRLSAIIVLDRNRSGSDRKQ